MTEDSILGYDLYSSALSEILSEPSLHTPITVGLYAKWGSGKSFLLNQLRVEMKSFARLTRVVHLKLNLFMVVTICMLSLLIVTPFLLWQWAYGLILYALLLVLSFAVVFTCKFFHERKEREWAQHICDKLATHLSRFKLLLQVLFLNPYVSSNLNSEHKNLRFIFTEYGKISTIGGENALALMVGGLCTKMEGQLGLIVTRLCRVFYNKTHSHDKFKKFCCIPTFIISILIFLMLLSIAIFLRVKNFDLNKISVEEQAFLSTFAFIIGISILGSSVTWIKMIWNLVRSPKSRIRSIHMAHSKNDNAKDPKVESFIFQLKREVDLIAHTVKTIDSFTHSCTRLVIVIDGLDSCEQSKVVQILEIIHVLFTREGDPFISILAVDPHVLIKGIEGNLTAAFRNGSVNGNDYLRTIIHLPVFLQVDLSRAKALSKTPVFKKNQNASFKGSQDVLQTKKFKEDVSNSKTKSDKKGKNRRNTITTKPMSAYDLTDQLIKSDYFLDVNPRNLRRLINIIALTGRLLRAYHIDFNWRLLASWIYLNEQWPYRCSWLIMFYEEHESEFDDETTLNDIHERVKHHIPISNEPLLEMDRNARKFEQFIQTCKPALTVSIFKKLLPCTCNLDPYLIKLIKDSIDAFQEKLELLTHLNGINPNQTTLHNVTPFNSNSFPTALSSYLLSNSNSNNLINNNTNNNIENYPNRNISSLAHNSSFSKVQSSTSFDSNSCSARNNSQAKLIDFTTLNTGEYNVEIDMSKLLREMTVADVIEAMESNIDFINEDFKQIYAANLKENNINGKVLVCCDLNELKSELRMTFGDWQVFKDWILKQRELNNKFRNNVIAKSVCLPTVNSNVIAKSADLPIENQTIKKEIEKTTEGPNFGSKTQVQSSQRSGRKVEFFISPVVETTPIDTHNFLPEKQIETPAKSILHSQSSIGFDPKNEDLLCKQSSLSSHIAESHLLADSVISKQGSSNSLKSISDSDVTINNTNPVSKLGKKIYNYLNRQSSINSKKSVEKIESLKESSTTQTLLEENGSGGSEGVEYEDGEDSHSSNEDEKENLSNDESIDENVNESTRLT